MRGRAYFAVLFGVIVVVQVAALILQARAGFVPFRHAPTRVPYSWDMFAIQISRCEITWEPPLAIKGSRVAQWNDRGPRLEFEPVFNTPDDYERAARVGCFYRTSPHTVATLHCAIADGTEDERRIECP
jgi:hypothetical protein